MGRSVFISYAADLAAPLPKAPDFRANRDRLCKSALAVGFDNALPLGPGDLPADFRLRNAALLAAPRLAGYTMWKPQVILQCLGSLGPKDLLVYCDAGRSDYYHMRRFPVALASRARRDGFIAGPVVRQHGPMRKWTKRDAFVLLGMDGKKIASQPQIQATWSFWTPTAAAFAFLRAWRDACEDPRLVSDAPNTQGLPNYRDFIDHRHDQSLLTLLAYRNGAPVLDYRGRGLFPLLRLRRRSGLAHGFLKRIDDAEAMERRLMLAGLVRSFRDLRRVRPTTRRRRVRDQVA